MVDVEYCPPSELVNMNIDIKEAQKFPLDKLATLGVAFQPLTQLASYATGGYGQSGLYLVNTAGKTMLQSGGKYIGNLKATNGSVGGGLARMTQLPLDPTMLCMAVAIMAIEKKLYAIHEAQKEILDFLEMKEKAKLKGNLNALADVFNNYKFNWIMKNIKTTNIFSFRILNVRLNKALSYIANNLQNHLRKMCYFIAIRMLKTR